MLFLAKRFCSPSRKTSLAENPWNNPHSVSKADSGFLSQFTNQTSPSHSNNLPAPSPLFSNNLNVADYGIRTKMRLYKLSNPIGI